LTRSQLDLILHVSLGISNLFEYTLFLFGNGILLLSNDPCGLIFEHGKCRLLRLFKEPLAGFEITLFLGKLPGFALKHPLHILQLVHYSIVKLK